MTSKWFTSLLCGGAIVGTMLAGPLPAPAEQAPDKNGPGVARVSIIEGSAVVQRGDSRTQTAAVRNAPLLPGDYVSTGRTSRAELQFDGYTAVRLGGNVQARIVDNDPTNRRLQLADGTVEIGIVHDGRDMQVDTPSVTVRAGGTGDYRVSIGQDGSSWVTVRRGRADVVTPQRTYTLEEGRTLVARGAASNPSITYTSAVTYDSFDDFNAQRDQTMVAALNASPNLNPSIAGYDNLDAYGQWQDVAGYGQVWVPQQSADWAPYRDGSWVWEGGYGWTWVGSEPWGWAPYHYGRWFYADGYGWAWYPPPYAYAPVWAPALVGFFGFGAGISVGFGFPYIGWCPLAPYESFYPWYSGWGWTGYGWGSGEYYGTQIVNITNINIYRNFRHGGGSGTLYGRFGHGTVSGHAIAVTSRNLGGRVGTIRGTLPVRPTRDSLGFGGGALRAPVTFSKRFDSPRFASDRSLAARPSFEQQQRAVSRAIGTASHQEAPISHAGTPARAIEPARHDTAPAMRNNAPTQSWQRFNQDRGQERGTASMRASEPRTNAAAARSERPAAYGNARTSDSWGRFSQERGNAAAPVSNQRGAEERGNNAYETRSGSYGARAESPSRASAQRNPYGSPARESNPTYSRGSYPSYSRGSYPSYSRGSYPSYSRASYPSYQRQSAPAYSRGSYPSYQRESAPAYSRGSYGPASAAAHPSGGGGGGGGGGRASGGGRGNGGGRPPG